MVPTAYNVRHPARAGGLRGGTSWRQPATVPGLNSAVSSPRVFNFAFLNLFWSGGSALPVGLEILDTRGTNRELCAFGGDMFSEICATKIAARFVAFVALLFSPLFLSTAGAQVAGATLSVTVTDQSGGVVPKAEISIKNIATGGTRAGTTDPAGFYSVPNLLPGSYDVTATTSGFSSEVHTGITLTVGGQEVLPRNASTCGAVRDATS